MKPAFDLTGDTLRVARFVRPSLTVRLDDVLSVRDDSLLTKRHGRVHVPLDARVRVEAALASPTIDPDYRVTGAAFAGRLASPHAPRRMAERLVDAAEALSASDLHLEPGPEAARLRLRLAGVLVDLCSVTPAVGARLTAAWKGLAGCLPYRSDIVQEGRIGRAGVAADVRASFVPTAYGDRVALRLFGRLFELDGLGLPAATLEALRERLEAPTGLFLVAGATGAGKTTTLYACLSHLAGRRVGAHLSIEDPVEQRLKQAGVPVDQVEVDPARDLTGESLLVAALRQDLDVLSVGEIRTPAEARLAVQAAHTGRLVLAGVHAGSREEARLRLVDLGVDPVLLDRTVQGVVHQRLEIVPCACEATPCPSCHGLGRTRRLRADLEGAAVPAEQAA